MLRRGETTDRAWEQIEPLLPREGGKRVLPRAVRSWEVERRREGPERFDIYDGVLGVSIGYEERRFTVSELGAWRGVGSSYEPRRW